MCIFQFVLYTPAQAQSSTDPFSNPVILKYYSATDLQEIQQCCPEKFQTITYYYTQSFIVEPIACSECTPIDLHNFDISQYEYLRKTDELFTRDFDKYGFRLTLLPISQLTHRTPMQQDKLDAAKQSKQ